MTWVGLRDHKAGTYHPAGLGQTTHTPVDINGLLARGTLLIEFTARPDAAGQTVLAYEAQSPWVTGLCVTLNERGVLTVTQTQGAFRRMFTLATGLVDLRGCVVMTFSWDAPARTAMLSVEIIETGEIFSTQLQAPLPMSLRDAVRISTDPAQCAISDEVRFVSIADEIMPHGPLPSLSGQTMIPTPTGDVALAALRAGRLVRTSDGGIAQIRWVGQITVPARGRFAPLQLKAPYYGAGQDLICSAGQRVYLSGSEVEYLFATKVVSVAVGQISEGVQPVCDRTKLTQTYYQMLLDRPASVTVGGLQVACFDATAICQTPRLRAQSVLADLPPELLPKQAAHDAVALHDYEALTLCRMRAA